MNMLSPDALSPARRRIGVEATPLRACPCFAGSACLCAVGVDAEVFWRGRRVPPQTLRDAQRDFRSCAAHGFVTWSAATWRVFLAGYIGTSAWYEAQDSLAARAA